MGPIGPVHSWLPFQYLTGEGAGATLALTFAMNHPDLFAAVATLDGAPYAQAYQVANQPADGSTLRMRVGWDVWASWEPPKKHVPVATWLFTRGAPTSSEVRQSDYWKHADQVGQATTETIDGLRTIVYRNASNPSEQVRTTVVPQETTFDATMASIIWDRLFSHVARWTDAPNGRLGRLLTHAEVSHQFKVRNITVDGQNYVYYLNLPPNYRPGEHLPLVVCAHGGAYPAWLYLSQLKMQDVGRGESFITAYPQEPAYFWHFTDPDAADAHFIQKLVADVESNFGAHPHRIYMQGFSLGSGMTYMMGITHPRLFAAVSPNSGIGPMSHAVEARIEHGHWSRRASGLGSDTGAALSPSRRAPGRAHREATGDVAGVVRDRRGGDRGDDFEEQILAESGREETIDVLIVETSTLFDHRLCEA